MAVGRVGSHKAKMTVPCKLGDGDGFSRHFIGSREMRTQKIFSWDLVSHEKGKYSRVSHVWAQIQQILYKILLAPMGVLAHGSAQCADPWAQCACLTPINCQCQRKEFKNKCIF